MPYKKKYNAIIITLASTLSYAAYAWAGRGGNTTICQSVHRAFVVVRCLRDGNFARIFRALIATVLR